MPITRAPTLPLYRAEVSRSRCNCDSRQSPLHTVIHMTEPRHKWPKDAVRLDGRDQSDGCDRSERTCAYCGLVKITVHPPQGLPYRQWRTPGGVICPGDQMPVCVANEFETEAA